MKRKHVEASREARLWIGQVIIPVGGILVALLTTEAKYRIALKFNKFKESIKNKFKKSES